MIKETARGGLVTKLGRELFPLLNDLVGFFMPMSMIALQGPFCKSNFWGRNGNIGATLVREISL